MTHRILRISLVMLALVALVAGTCAAQERLKQLSEGGISVQYPPSMDAQAKKVLDIVKSSLTASIDVNRQVAAFLTNPEPMAKDIATLLGAEELQDDAVKRFQNYRFRSQALVQCFTNIRLVKKSDGVVGKGIDAGLMQVKYMPDKDEFNMVLDTNDTSEARLKASFFPVFINADGSIRAENKIADMALKFMGSGGAMVVAPVHETVSYLMTEQLKLYHPLARWFSDGVSGWITKRVVLKNNPKLTDTVNQLLTVSSKSKELKGKINLLAWTQMAYQNRQSNYYDAALEAAQTQYAVEAVNDLLGKTGDTVLPKIMSELNYIGNPDTNKICEAIKKITSKDFMPTLLTYVPNDIREGKQSGEAKKLYDECQSLVKNKKWADTVVKLRKVLDMTPDDVNIRLDLAWTEREINERLDSEIQIFTAAALLKQEKHSFSLLAPSIEGNYVLARLAILMGDIQSAKLFLKPVLEIRPSHADAKKAMDEIKKLEGATGANNASGTSDNK